MKNFLLLFSLLIASTTAFSQTVFISEIHYDDIGTDTLEGVEISGPAGTNLACYSIELYNGSSNALYATTPLSGSIDNEAGTGYGAVWIPISGMQNGGSTSPVADGIALVSVGGAGCPAAGIIQFLSYEAAMTAIDGAAIGITSSDIGVTETNATLENTSLQLSGTGSTYTSFVWNPSGANSLGSINAGMSFGAATSGNVCGILYNDINANGSYDTGEPTLSGATVTATPSSGAAYTGTSGAGGNYCISGLPASVYTLTTPTGTTTSISVTVGTTATANIPVTTLIDPTVSFATTSGFGTEAAVGSATISLNFAASAPITVAFTLSGSAINGTDYNVTTPVTIPSGTSTFPISLGVIDDAIIEAVDTIKITLVAGAGYTLGTFTMFNYLINDNDATLQPISTFTNEDATGVATSVGSSAVIEGLVYGGNLRASTTGTAFTVIDATSGIAVFNGIKTFGYTVVEGDKVRISGVIAQFQGLTQIVADTIIKLSSANALTAPASISIINESTESKLITIAGGPLTLTTPSEWAPASNPNGFNISLSNGATTYIMRIDNDVDLFTLYTSAPGSACNVIGIGGQFDNATPYDMGYQIIPRYSADVLFISGINDTNHKASLYPNPTTNVFNLSSTLPIQNIRIISIDGRTMLNQAYDNSNAIALNASDWAKGMYLITINTTQGVETLKIILE